MTLPALIRRRVAEFLADTGGAGAVEFVFVIPIMVALYLGGYEVAQLVTTYRKVCDVTSQLADIGSQTTTPTDEATLNTVMAASSQIMSPDSTSDLSIVFSEITADNTGAATVTWSRAYNGGTALTPKNSWTLPAALKSAAVAVGGESYLLIQTSYTYHATFGASYIGATIPLSDQLYIPPRNVSSITCSDCPTS